MKKLAISTSMALYASMATTAIAADTKSYPGLECVEQGDTTSEILFTRISMINWSHDMQIFNCPFVRPNSSTAGSLTSASIHVNDKDFFSHDFRCFVQSCNAFGTDCVSTPTVVSTGTREQRLDLPSISAFSNGYAYISCEVPGDDSEILSYRITD